MTDGWNPDGDVLVVGHSIDPALVGDISRRLPGTDVQVMDLDDLVGAEDYNEFPGSDEPSESVDDLDSGFPPASDLAVAAIESQLEGAPTITTLLATSRWAARDVWRVVRPRPDLRAFTHLDNLERARAAPLDLDVTPHGRRRNSHRFAVEFAGEEGLPAWDPRARVRVLVGPANEDGVAAGWAIALRHLRGVDAVSLAVGDDGFPAEVMATSADWDTKSVRRAVLAFAASATHILVDDPEAAAAEALRGTGPTIVVASTATLPVAVAPGAPPDREETPMQVAVIGSTEADDVPATWRVTRFADMPRSLWAATARHADLIVDRRDPFRLDSIVLNGMANGAVLVAADLPPGRLQKKLPHLRNVTDPLLAGETVMRRLRADSIKYVRRHHTHEVVASKLRRALRVH